ncbi:aldolase/citrate lyase family protein [Lentzea tibetensis]|uniref:aldolase/citrate lyase family protein n=1 Tax=Lentzea tibetensis TaxID=2591470 RepID=UPI0016470F86|nr:aldolase/citrate lyase family protein [Lentzea tibetensis]
MTFPGRPASTGIALGSAYRTDRVHPTTLPRRCGGDPVQHIIDAFDAVHRRMLDLAESLRSQGQPEQADIMEVAGYIAADPDLRATAVRHAEQGSPVTVAISQAVHVYATALSHLDDATLAERATDVRQIGRRALAWLHGDTDTDHEGPLVLFAHEIGAADLLEPHAPVVAAVSVTGGPNSHAAIVARSLGIPLLLGVDRAALDVADGVEVLVDHRQVVLHPEEGERRTALSTMDQLRARRVELRTQRDLASQTSDGHTVVLRANIATPADARAAVDARCDGVGLLRTELPFLDAATWPSFGQHTAALVPVFRQLAGRPVTVRTLDYADDKLPPFLRHEGQQLGRGLPLMLAAPEAFTDQFRAILTAGAATDLRVMIPMVADAAELRACRELLDKAAAEIGVTSPPLGAMVELPEAVANIDQIAAEAGFISIGSNDLTCQILGLDRRDPAAAPAMTAHPDVLRAIAAVVTTAHDHGLQVSVCGDAATHRDVIPLLVGLDCDILSVAPSAADEVRARVRSLARTRCAALAADALACSTIEEVRQLLEAVAPTPAISP